MRSDHNGATGRMLRKVPTAQVTEFLRAGRLGRGGHVPARQPARAPAVGVGALLAGAGMSAPEILRPEVLARLRDLGQADIVVGIPSYQQRRRRSATSSSAAAGGPGEALPGTQSRDPELRRRLDGRHARGGGGRQRARRGRGLLVSHPVRPVQQPQRCRTTALPGQGQRVADDLRGRPSGSGAQACAVVDADLRSITPEWIQPAGRPGARPGLRLRGAATTTGTSSTARSRTTIVYPLTRALYGQRDPAADRRRLRRVRARWPAALPRACRSGKPTWRASASTSG
ncbi:MAG: hypothetical protein MZV63_18125 [Marinilabiliales bacterium]|nr:hypothetical protein [Marinilabiliales bacterium]